MAKLKRVGYDYLHKHTEMEKQLNVPTDHVIVDRKDWEEVVRFFNENPDHIKLIGESKHKIDLGG